MSAKYVCITHIHTVCIRNNENQMNRSHCESFFSTDSNNFTYINISTLKLKRKIH